MLVNALRICISLALGSLLAGPSLAAEAEEPRRIFDGVALAPDAAIVAHAGDLWRVPLTGGRAVRLTEGPAEDERPVVAPDGLFVAFARASGGNTDVFLVPVGGGEERRLTFNPKLDVPVAFAPDGKTILFLTMRDGDRLFRIYRTGLSGNDWPEALPLPWGADAAPSPDGARLAYAPVAYPLDLGDYRYYRGGRTSPLWIADLATSEVEPLTGAEANHRSPQWVDDTLLYLSDESGTYNVWARDLESGGTNQLTAYEDHGVFWLSVRGRRGLLARGGRLELLDRDSGAVTPLEARFELESSELEARRLSAAEYLDTVALAPAGDRIAIEARGELLVRDLVGGALLGEVTGSASAERGPVFSPDGQRLAYFSDAGGEYALHIARLDGGERERTVVPIEASPSFYRQLVWSPDGRHLAFTGLKLGLWLAEVETGSVRRVAVSTYLAQEEFHPSFSPDGRYLAYAEGLPTHQRVVWVVDLASGERRRVSGDEHADQPVWDRSGRYLHYLASNTAGMLAANSIWGLASAQLFAPLGTRSVHTVVLHPGEAAPFSALRGRPIPAEGEVPAGALDFKGLSSRVVRLPVPEKDYVQLEAGGPGELYLVHRRWSDAPGADFRQPTPLTRFTLADGEHVELAEDVDAFAVSEDGRVLLTLADDEVSVSRDREEALPVDLSPLELAVDPGLEWRQMFDETWRMMRDRFYDPNHHGQDLEALRGHYAEYLPGITRRADLNRLFRRMLGHVSISHLGIRGGDVPEDETPPGRVATLGAEFEVDRGHYRLSRIYPAGPAAASRGLVRAAPLGQPGVDAREGDFLLAIDGEPLDASVNLFSRLEGKAWGPVELTLASDPEGRDRREVRVVSVGGDNSIKTAAFFEHARSEVERLSQGRLAYIAMPDYGPGSIMEFFRQFVGLADREGLILDQRWGPGGTTSDHLIFLLANPALHRYVFPYGEDLTVPTSLLAGPKIVLINEMNGSASETFPAMFQIAGLGTVVGKRTMGAGTGGAMAYPRLVDGGRITIPNRAAYDPRTGEWLENRGVVPDVEVEWWPSEWRAGRDSQLEKAVELALTALEEGQSEGVVRRPAYPVHP